MGNRWSAVGGHNHRVRQRVNIKPLLMPSRWTDNDVLYVRIASIREMIEEMGIGCILEKIVKFLHCQVGNCKCKGGLIDETKGYSEWRGDIPCSRSGCDHSLSDHMHFLNDASSFDLSQLLKLVFDMVNIKGTLENEARKPKLERNIVLEGILDTIYGKLSYCVDGGPYLSFNVENIYGTPPFEDTNIDQALMNFCVNMSGHNKAELIDSLKVTKFVLRYFDSWTWVMPKELSSSNSRQFSNSYTHYYRRYMVYCCLPRCVQSISHRYRPSKIFGKDVLRYLFKIFRMQLHSWCNEDCITWSIYTKQLLLVHLPKYMDLLEKEIYAATSLIWVYNYERSDIKKMLIESLPQNSISNSVESQPLEERMTSMRDV